MKAAEGIKKTTGAAMALIKKIDVEEHFAARRAMRLGRIGLLSPPIAARAAPAVKVAKAPRFIDDHTSEILSPSVSATAIPIMSSSGRNRLLKPPGSRQE